MNLQKIHEDFQKAIAKLGLNMTRLRSLARVREGICNGVYFFF
jgi:hypothetical protein